MVVYTDKKKSREYVNRKFYIHSTLLVKTQTKIRFCSNFFTSAYLDGIFSSHRKCIGVQKKPLFQRTPKTIEAIPIILTIWTPVWEFHNTYRTKTCVVLVINIRVKKYDKVKSELCVEICDATKLTRCFSWFAVLNISQCTRLVQKIFNHRVKQMYTILYIIYFLTILWQLL